jgi:hypothetical protein
MLTRQMIKCVYVDQLCSRKYLCRRVDLGPISVKKRLGKTKESKYKGDSRSNKLCNIGVASKINEINKNT